MCELRIERVSITVTPIANGSVFLDGDIFKVDLTSATEGLEPKAAITVRNLSDSPIDFCHSARTKSETWCIQAGQQKQVVLAMKEGLPARKVYVDGKMVARIMH